MLVTQTRDSIHGVPGLSLGRETNYYDMLFIVSLQRSSVKVSKLGHDRFLPVLFQLIIH
jgi:hypothetical protein